MFSGKARVKAILRDAVAQLDDDEKGTQIVGALGGRQRMTRLSEAGIYGLMLIRRPEGNAQVRRGGELAPLLGSGEQRQLRQS